MLSQFVLCLFLLTDSVVQPSQADRDELRAGLDAERRGRHSEAIRHLTRAVLGPHGKDDLLTAYKALAEAFLGREKEVRISGGEPASERAGAISSLCNALCIDRNFAPTAADSSALHDAFAEAKQHCPSGEDPAVARVEGYRKGVEEGRNEGTKRERQRHDRRGLLVAIGGLVGIPAVKNENREQGAILAAPYLLVGAHEYGEGRGELGFGLLMGPGTTIPDRRGVGVTLGAAFRYRISRSLGATAALAGRFRSSRSSLEATRFVFAVGLDVCLHPR